LHQGAARPGCSAKEGGPGAECDSKSDGSSGLADNAAGVRSRARDSGHRQTQLGGAPARCQAEQGSPARGAGPARLRESSCCTAVAPVLRPQLETAPRGKQGQVFASSFLHQQKSPPWAHAAQLLQPALQPDTPLGSCSQP